MCRYVRAAGGEGCVRGSTSRGQTHKHIVIKKVTLWRGLRSAGRRHARSAHAGACGAVVGPASGQRVTMILRFIMTGCRDSSLDSAHAHEAVSGQPPLITRRSASMPCRASGLRLLGRDLDRTCGAHASQGGPQRRRGGAAPSFCGWPDSRCTDRPARRPRGRRARARRGGGARRRWTWTGRRSSGGGRPS